VDEIKTAMIDHSPTLGKLFAALANAQKTIGLAHKGATAHKYKYADLPEVYEVSRGPLTENGLCITSFPDGVDGLVNVLGHSSGEYMMTRAQMPPRDKTPQSIGAALTYMRRYAHAAIAGVATTDDKHIENKEAKKRTKVSDAPSNEARWSKVKAAFAFYGIDEQTLLADKAIGVKVEDLNEGHFEFLHKWYMECQSAASS